LFEQMIILEEMIMAKGSMGHHQCLHGHGIFFHDVTDTGIGIDDNFVSQAAETFAVHAFIAQETFAKGPVIIHHRHAHR